MKNQLFAVLSRGGQKTSEQKGRSEGDLFDPFRHLSNRFNPTPKLKVSHRGGFEDRGIMLHLALQNR